MGSSSLPVPAELSAGRGKSITNTAHAKCSLVCTSVETAQAACVRVSGGALAVTPMLAGQQDTQNSDRGGRPGRRVKADTCFLFLWTRCHAKLSTGTP